MPEGTVSRCLGSVVVPAHNEAKVIARTLEPLSRAAVDGRIDVVVVCNGCIDDTATVARGIPGIRVVELARGSKPAALNAGDAAARCWPRLYLDADIEISLTAVLAVLDRLSVGDVLAARPRARYETTGAAPAIKRYYAARGRISLHQTALWGAGVYGLSPAGHARLGAFPELTGDDLYVDRLFGVGEKAIVDTEPAVVRVPGNVASLLATLRRWNRGNKEIIGTQSGLPGSIWDSGLGTALGVLATVRSPRTAYDAITYLTISAKARLHRKPAGRWERDDSSRI